MKIDDIITLGKMGFTAEQVKQMMQLESPAQPQMQTQPSHNWPTHKAGKHHSASSMSAATRLRWHAMLAS